MDEYAYKAYDVSGQMQVGSIRAPSPRQAIKGIGEQGLYVVALARKRRPAFSFPWLRRQFQRQYVMMFCRQLAVMVKAGLPVSECLRLLSQQEPAAGGRHLAEDLLRQVQEGRALSAALQEHGDVFPPLVVHFVRIGEVSGNLDAILEQLAVHLELSYKAREKLITLLIYPVILLVVTLLSLLFLLQFVLPVFSGLFISLQAELPWPTRLLLWLYEWLQAYGGLAAALWAALAISAWQAYKREACRLWVDRCLLHLPWLGALAVYSELMQFARTLAMLLSSGLLMDQALLILHDTTRNMYLKSVFLHLRSDIQKGQTLSASLKKKAVFPAIMVELLATGEMTGELDMILGKVADFCRIEAESLSERLRALLEPAMILIMGGVIGLIIFAIALPVLDAMTMYAG